jgi:hypothetical protein
VGCGVINQRYSQLVLQRFHTKAWQRRAGVPTLILLAAKAARR